MTAPNSDPIPTGHDEAIHAQLATGYWIRAVLIGFMCLALGLWGVYDYVYAIPKQEQAAQRRDLAQSVKVVLDAHEDRAATAEQYEETLDRVNANLAEYATPVSLVADAAAPITSDVGWHVALELWKSTLESMQQEPGAVASSRSMESKSEIERANTAYGDIQAPSAYDRPIQWMFIVSLVFVPYYIRQLMLHCGKIYTLDEGGGFHGPDGTLAADEIADIDMSRWMKKSIAELVDSNGNRTTLDAYIYKDLHLIIGAIAHRLHPDKWTAEAKIVKEQVGSDSNTGDDVEEEG